MNENFDTEAYLESMKIRLDKAKKEGAFMWHPYQDLWMSPYELEKEHANKKFMWIGWELRDPMERCNALIHFIHKARSDYNIFFKKLSEYQEQRKADNIAEIQEPPAEKIHSLTNQSNL